MITAIRLREWNKKLNHLMRTYTSVNGTMFRAGDDRFPSPLRVITDPAVIAEVRGIPQFEVIEVEDARELDARLTTEMERRARMGAMAVRAEVQNLPAPAPVMLAAIIAPTPIGAGPAPGAEVQAWDRNVGSVVAPLGTLPPPVPAPAAVKLPEAAPAEPRSGRKAKSWRGRKG